MKKLLAALAMSAVLALPAAAQGVMGDMHGDVNEVQKKFLDLARAIPAEKFDWRPGAGVRSIGEVLLHVTGENYQIPIFFGKPAPAASGITADFATAMAFEKKKFTKDQLIAELEASFKNLHQGLGLTTDANANQEMEWFGMKMSRQKAVVGTVTHLHEHLGQLIAYARMNGVVPPWSR